MRKLTPCLFCGALLCAVFFTGCATITRGTKEELLVQSDPPGAQVRLSNGLTGITPVTFTVPRKGNLYVTVSKEGFETTMVFVSTKISGAGAAGFLGNALIGGVIGGGLDAYSGATLSHNPNPVVVGLKAKPPAAIAKAAQPEPAAAEASPAPVAAATVIPSGQTASAQPVVGSVATRPDAADATGPTKPQVVVAPAEATTPAPGAPASAPPKNVSEPPGDTGPGPMDAAMR